MLFNGWSKRFIWYSNSWGSFPEWNERWVWFKFFVFDKDFGEKFLIVKNYLFTVFGAIFSKSFTLETNVDTF